MTSRAPAGKAKHSSPALTGPSARRTVAHAAALLAALLAVGAVPQRGSALACPGDCNRDSNVTIEELIVGVGRLLGDPALEPLCSAADIDGDAEVSLGEAVAAVESALHGCRLARVPFRAELTQDGAGLLLTPLGALRGSGTYSVVLTSGVHDAQGRALQADAAFRASLGLGPAEGDGPVALFSDDPEAAGNPYPEARLVRDDGTVHVPDRFALAGLEEREDLATARGVLRATADQLEGVHGFSTTAPVRIALSALVDLSTVNAQTVLFFERSDGGLDMNGALRAAAGAGVSAAAVALAISFPTQPIEDDLLAIRDLFDAMGDDDFRVVLQDPDPQDDLPIGVFGPGQFDDCAGAGATLPIVVSGLLPTRDFRGEDGIFDPRKIDGTAPPEIVPVRFLLAVPDSPPPHRVVILQHGFAGSDCFVLSLAEELGRDDLAVIGISAVSHGRRGNFFDLLNDTPLMVRDIFRQTHADQMALVRAIEAGIDWNGDGTPDLDPHDIGYLGVSLGGILGSTFIAVEDAVQAAVLNVTGGRVAFLGENPGTRDIYAAAYAQRAQLEVGTPEFETFLRRLLALGQQALDPADGLNFARRWRIDPLPGSAPRRVLMQEGIGDALVSNESTEELAAAGGVPAEVALTSPDGVSALWRFDGPGGHGILSSRADVRAQATVFLASGGTRIIDPFTPAD
jgi:hypothetical protein